MEGQGIVLRDGDFQFEDVAEGIEKIFSALSMKGCLVDLNVKLYEFVQEQVRGVEG